MNWFIRLFAPDAPPVTPEDWRVPWKQRCGNRQCGLGWRYHPRAHLCLWCWMHRP